jgi:FkbM family methyltransferase
MNPLAILRDTYDVLTRHPLNRERKLAAVKRYLRWQLGSLLAPGQVAVEFVDDTLLLGSFGMTSTSCNVYAGLYEWEDMAFVLHLLGPGDLFVDVGANVGVYTVLAAGAAGAHAIAVEPSPDTFAQLKRNVQLNGLDERVALHNLALSDTPGSARFTRGLGAMNRFAGAADGDTCEVPVTTLDALVGDRAASLLKIDVEGYETLVLRGAEEFLARPSLRAIVMETNGSGAERGFDEAALSASLVQRGFSLCRYEPFSRTLTVTGAVGGFGNSLFVRDLDAVRAQLARAPKHRVHGQLV